MTLKVETQPNFWIITDEDDEGIYDDVQRYTSNCYMTVADAHFCTSVVSASDVPYHSPISLITLGPTYSESRRRRIDDTEQVLCPPSMSFLLVPQNGFVLYCFD